MCRLKLIACSANDVQAKAINRRKSAGRDVKMNRCLIKRMGAPNGIAFDRPTGKGNDVPCVLEHETLEGILSGPRRQQHIVMTQQQVLDQYFMDARHKLLDVAAFLDRLDRAEGDSDFRLEAFREAITKLSTDSPERASDVLMVFSDPTTEPIPAATTKAACGAWPGPEQQSQG